MLQLINLILCTSLHILSYFHTLFQAVIKPKLLRTFIALDTNFNAASASVPVPVPKWLRKRIRKSFQIQPESSHHIAHSQFTEMLDILRDSTIGGLVNIFSHGRLLPFPDQRDDFRIPERFLAPTTSPRSKGQPNKAIPHVAEATYSDSKKLVGEKILCVTTSSVEYDGSPSNLSLEAQSLKTSGCAREEHTLVDWYSEDDPENPRNWSLGKRIFVTAEIAFLTYVRFSLHDLSKPHVLTVR